MDTNTITKMYDEQIDRCKQVLSTLQSECFCIRSSAGLFVNTGLEQKACDAPRAELFAKYIDANETAQMCRDGAGSTFKVWTYETALNNEIDRLTDDRNDYVALVAKYS